VAPSELTADQRSSAETLGKQYNATIVIWGEDTGVQVFVNFLNLKQSDFAAAYVPIKEEQRTAFANPSAYNAFIVSDLPGQLTFLSFFAVGQSFYQAENYTQAKELIEQGIASLATGTRINGLAEAYFRLGWLYQVPLGDLTSAIADYTKAIELDPKYAAAYNNRGFALYDQGDLAAAIKDYTKAIELDPKLAQLYNNRGNALSDQGDLAAAIQDYTKVIELDPNYALAYYNTAKVYALQGQVEPALPPLRRALELNAARYLELIPTNTDFDKIRDDPRFQTLLTEFGPKH
jgi:tetratricopeptide (TPR) repeat protein